MQSIKYESFLQIQGKLLFRWYAVKHNCMTIDFLSAWTQAKPPNREEFPCYWWEFLKYLLFCRFLVHGLFLSFFFFCLIIIKQSFTWSAHADVQIHSTFVNSYQGQALLVKIFHSLSFFFYRIKCVIPQLVTYIVWNENSKGLSLTFTDLGEIQLWKLATYTSPRKKSDLSKIELKASISQPLYGKLDCSCRNTPSKGKHDRQKLMWSCTVKKP